MSISLKSCANQSAKLRLILVFLENLGSDDIFH